MRALRALALALAIALLGTACRTDVEPVRGEDLIEQAGKALDDLADGGGPAAPAPDAPPDQGQPDPRPEGPAGTAPPPAAEAPTVRIDDRAGLGGMCRAYLRSDLPRLIVEIAHQAGAAPSQEAVNHLVSVLRTVVDKPGGVLVESIEIPGGGRTWTRSDLEQAAREHRRHSSGPDQAVMQVLSLHGEFEEQDAIGVAFDATTFALFPDQLDGLARLLGGRPAIERAVLVHEAGHLLCLINITYTSAFDHEDPEHPSHARDSSSVMYWAVANSAVAQAFAGPPPADFTATERADLEALRTDEP